MLPPMEPALCDKLKALKSVIAFASDRFEVSSIVLARLTTSDNDFRASLTDESGGGMRHSLASGDAAPALAEVMAAGGAALEAGVTSETLPAWCARALLSLGTTNSDHLCFDDTLQGDAWVGAGLMSPQSTMSLPGQPQAALMTQSGSFLGGEEVKVTLAQQRRARMAHQLTCRLIDHNPTVFLVLHKDGVGHGVHDPRQKLWGGAAVQHQR